ncbi:MAG: alpha/beta hydrolase [Sulfuricaulis sp.]|uniref:alpha/beta hydrolase n=1 Tax=Sulfuricaulis sp. TaxID=2003553 RepID=UPI003C38C8F9
MNRTAACLLMLLVFAGTAGCASVQPHMIPTPAVFRDARLDMTVNLPSELRSTEVPVFYATTRAPVDPGKPGHYRNAAGDGVMLGVASVRLGPPGWQWEDLVASDFADTYEHARPGDVERIQELGRWSGAEGASEAERAFVARINEQLTKTRNPEVVLYVHGYRVRFDEVTVMMGSWSHYLGHGALVTFQWPTGQNFWNYLTDCPRAEQYVPDIERLIALLSETRAESVNIIAYSCGSPLLGQALARLRARHPQEDRAQLAQRYRIGNVIFVASDVDLKTFAGEYMPPVMDLARQTIVYMSRNDAALGFSSLIAGASRLGKPDIADLTVQDIQRLAADPRFQAVDVSDVRGAHEMGGMRGHGYWYANDWISTDVALSLRHPIDPADRCLIPGPNRVVWKFPENYVDCLVQRLGAAFPELRRSAPKGP